jgi:hypothetical protein
VAAGELTGIRIEVRRPRSPNGLGGSTEGSCSFAGTQWGFRFYGRDWLFTRKGNTKAWRSLSRAEQAKLRNEMLAALEQNALGRARRANESRKFREGMHWTVREALRDRQRAPRRPARRPARRVYVSSKSRRHVRRAQARSPGSKEPSPSPSRLVAARKGAT